MKSSDGRVAVCVIPVLFVLGCVFFANLKPLARRPYVDETQFVRIENAWRNGSIVMLATPLVLFAIIVDIVNHLVAGTR